MKKACNHYSYRLFHWSEWRDLNSRPLDPQSSALPTALHPEISACSCQLIQISTLLQKMQDLFSNFFQIIFDAGRSRWNSVKLRPFPQAADGFFAAGGGLLLYIRTNPGGFSRFRKARGPKAGIRGHSFGARPALRNPVSGFRKFPRPPVPQKSKGRPSALA